MIINAKIVEDTINKLVLVTEQIQNDKFPTYSKETLQDIVQEYESCMNLIIPVMMMVLCDLEDLEGEE